MCLRVCSRDIFVITLCVWSVGLYVFVCVCVEFFFGLNVCIKEDKKMNN